MKRDYKDTLNLPRSSFKMKADLARKEPQFRRNWEELGLYARLRKEARGKAPYILHDGPPYPTGDLHIGTGMNKILKDIIVRFHNMNNRDAPFIPGWDCHGLPIEHKVMTGLGEKAPTISDADIRRRCRQFALTYVEANRSQFKSLGCLGDWDNPYLTISPHYEAAVLKVFHKLVERGYIYRQLKPIHWCFSCRTALAEAELEYEERSDTSIYLALPLLSPVTDLFGEMSPGEVSLLVWTTTPWTLPGNLAAALHPRFQYALVECDRPGGEGGKRVIMAADSVTRVMKELSISSYQIRGKVAGRKLENFLYRHPWFDKQSPVILADYVNLGEGTGCVHTAPGHGQEDYLSGRKYNLAVFSPVDSRGDFTEEVPELAGENVFSANRIIIQRLEERGLLWLRKDISHSYPHCWRCHQPVIFRATQQWFLSLDNRQLRHRALEEVEKVRWIPSWGKDRIRGMLEQRPDWCISRQRKWGVPIPVFYCNACEEPLLNLKVIEYVIRLFAERGSDCWFELSESELLPEGVKCPRCGSNDFRKEKDIFDVWFESGSSHRAVVMENPELEFPADLYLEGTDQHRGWFQLSLLLSTASIDRSPFKAVLTHGFVVDQKGEKMSKSRGNFISVEEALKKFPADILRLWFSSVNYQRDINVSPALIERASDAYRKIRNTFKHILGNLSDFDPDESAVGYDELTEIDRWALQEVEELRRQVTRAYSDFDFHQVHRLIHNFCVLQMSSFYLDVLKDRLYTYPPDCRERRSSQTVLSEIAVILAKLLAPILCFTAEEVWAHLPGRGSREESIHLSRWPTARPEWKNEDYKDDWEKLLNIRDRAMKHLENARAEGKIGNSLEARVIIRVGDEKWAEFLEDYQTILPMLLIVSQVEIERIPPVPEKVKSPSDGIEPVRIIVERARGKKCVRCWKFSPSVGESAEHPELCAECLTHRKHFLGGEDEKKENGGI